MNFKDSYGLTGRGHFLFVSTWLVRWMQSMLTHYVSGIVHHGWGGGRGAAWRSAIWVSWQTDRGPTGAAVGVIDTGRVMRRGRHWRMMMMWWILPAYIQIQVTSQRSSLLNKNKDARAGFRFVFVLLKSWRRQKLCSEVAKCELKSCFRVRKDQKGLQQTCIDFNFSDTVRRSLFSFTFGHVF